MYKLLISKEVTRVPLYMHFEDVQNFEAYKKAEQLYTSQAFRAYCAACTPKERKAAKRKLEEAKLEFYNNTRSSGL